VPLRYVHHVCSWDDLRLKAICGAVLFSLFLVYDFNRLKQLSDIGINDWSTALKVAISIYLDILNLLLEIMQAMGDS
jgi:FtsH-binding integral membrane protein